MSIKKVENIVIGGGPGGYVAAIKLAQLGKSVTLIEKESLGGVCLNVGCIPSKALINAGHMVDKIKLAQDLGFNVSLDQDNLIDMEKLQAWKGKVVDRLVGGVKHLLKANNVDHVRGTAFFKSRNQIEVTSGDEKSVLEFENVIIATGSTAIEIPGFKFDEEKILSSTGGLDLKKVPEELVVIGGGYIGLEIGTFYAKLGTKLTIVEATENLLPTADADLVNIVARKLKRKKTKIMLETKAKGVSEKDGKLAVLVETKKGEETILADNVLVTVGRRANLKGYGLENTGVKTEGGFIKVNSKLQTNIPNIYAIGDVAGQPMLAHKASKEGIVAAEVIAGKKSEMDFYAMPAVVFTDPEIASVGLSEKEVKEQDYKYKIGKFPFSALGKALASGESEGFVKVIVDEETEVLLGLHIVGHEASSLISEGALAIEMGATAEDLALTIHPHPTLPEAIMEAAEAAIGKAIHMA